MSKKVQKIFEESLLHLWDPGIESKVRVVAAVTTLLLHAPELGNTQIREGLLEMMLVMARSDDYIQQLVASEAIIAAASKKKDVTVIVQQAELKSGFFFNKWINQDKIVNRGLRRGELKASHHADQQKDI